MIKKTKKLRVLHKLGVSCIVFVLLLGLVACGSSKSSGLMSENKAPSAQLDKMSGASSQSVTVTSMSDQYGETASGEGGSSEAANSAQYGGIGTIADANSGFDRKVVYRANMVMKVEQFAKAEEQLLNLIHLGGAYVLEFSDSRNMNEVGANYVIKVPSSGFSSFLENLQKIEAKIERDVTGSDVTEEYVDLGSRLKAKQTVEERLLNFMDKATKSDDLLRYSNELANVQEQIEQIKGRMRYLDQNVAFSTVNLRLYQGAGAISSLEEDNKAFGTKIADTFNSSMKGLRMFGEGLLIVIVAIFPTLLVLAVIGIPTFILLRKRHIARSKQAAEKRATLNKANQQTEEVE
ncbi:MAG: DUF4349 domain-containing protein [Candidatus Cohnella colombiensis]|uniref:DUF4349 domain-containing protein n=1 Tax=Candidatus Cohnella colombiensis TaxID=3121368 RepID=A0AA95ET76_9BACL|nr:MAG: DUF4349 domain-containing protein [Cohnella sp.]